MSTTQRRWDGRTWLARTSLAILPVLVLGVSRGGDLPAAVAIAVVWIPLVSATAWLQLRHRGTVQRLVAFATDVVALSLLAQLAPALTPTVLVLLVAAGLLHAARLSWSLRAAVIGIMLVAQVLALVTTAVSSEVVGLVAVLDVAAAVFGTLFLGEQDRHRRRSLAALHRADELTDAVLAGIGEAVVVTDAAGTITSANAATEATFGVEPRGSCHEALGLHRGAGTLDCSRGCPLLDEAAGRGQAEVSRDHPGGTRQVLLANVRSIRSPTGRVREVVHSYRDVTSLKQAEQAKTLFLATASHELKTPVAVITGYATLLEEGGLPEQQRDTAISTIRSRAAQLSEIIERLLLASRIEGGGMTMSTEPIDLLPLLHERVDALADVTSRQIVTEAPDEAPPVDADRIAVVTVLDHLIENAIKYSPDGGPVVVSVRVGEETVSVDVADEGVGMSAREAEQCFDAFWQAEGDATRRFGGSGVGLYIVRSMSRAMGGDTTVVRAVPGAGTTFRFTLVRADAARPAAATDARDERPDTMIDEFMRQVGVAEDR